METLKASETVIEGLVSPKEDETAGSMSFSLGKEECVQPDQPMLEAAVETGCVSSHGHGDGYIKGISLYVELTGGVINKPDGERVRDVGREDFRVNVGDLVWAIIKKQSWWPGVVCDASEAPKEVANYPTREDDCLVRFFGSGSYIWCPPYQVKPFIGYFDRIPSQSQGKKFLDALDMAVVDLGQRVKTEFTCSCFSKIKMEKANIFSDLSVDRFEPVTFLDYIKNLARDSLVPDKIDYVVKKNCLSAFCCSLGHLEIPIQQLKLAFGSPSKIKIEEENGLFVDDFEKPVKLFGIRDRKKSSFLSYPGDNEGVDLNKNNGQSQPAKKPRKKWSKKNKGAGLDANVCCSDVLSQVRFAAQDCVFPYESKTFDSVQRFISGFRKRTFTDSSNEIPTEMLNHQTVKETLPKKAKRKKDKSVISPAFVNFQNAGSLSHAPQSVSNNGTANHNGFFSFQDLLTSQQLPCDTDISALPFVNGHMQGFYQAPFGSTQPCFTGNYGEPQAGLGPGGLGHVPKKRGRKKKNINLQPNPGSTVTPDFTGNLSEPQTGLVPVGLCHVPKKRGRKRKNIDLQTNTDSTIIPNLNENGSEKKREKLSKTKEVGVQCIDLSYIKVQQDNVEEVRGTAFLLKFSPDYPIPSNQDLNLVFSKYGVLIESETQVSNENLSGQVVFLDSSSAGGAFWSLQNDKPFGPVLVNYRIQHLDAESVVQFKTPIKSPSAFKPVDSQAVISSPIVPNTNANSTEVQVVKISKTVEEIRLPSINNQSNGDVTGTSLHLKFSPNDPLPSVQDLNKVFCKYGELNESETQVSSQDFTGQVVFINASTAGEAIQRLETDRPFGQALLSYQVHHLYSSVQPAIRTPSKMKPCQDLGVVKKNLEMMKLMLEKDGDSLSMEMRGKLECEIKGLMNKVSAIDGSSS